MGDIANSCGNFGKDDCKCDYDPMCSAAARCPEAFIAGYFSGWRSALTFAEVSGLTFAPHPFFQASPRWVAGQMLLNEITPMVRREMPYVGY